MKKKQKQRKSNVSILTGWLYRFFGKQLLAVAFLILLAEILLLAGSRFLVGAQSLDYYIEACHLGWIFSAGIGIVVFLLIKFHLDGGKKPYGYYGIQMIPMDPMGYYRAMSRYLFTTTILGMLLQIFYLFLVYYLCDDMHMKNGFYVGCHRSEFGSYLLGMTPVSFVIMLGVTGFISLGVPALLLLSYKERWHRWVVWGLCGLIFVPLCLPDSIEQLEIVRDWSFFSPVWYRMICSRSFITGVMLLVLSLVLFLLVWSQLTARSVQPVAEAKGKKKGILGCCCIVILYLMVLKVTQSCSQINLMELITLQGDARVLENFVFTASVCEESKNPPEDQEPDQYMATISLDQNESNYLKHPMGTQYGKDQKELLLVEENNGQVALYEGTEYASEIENERLFTFSKDPDVKVYRAASFADRIVVLGWNVQSEDLVFLVYEKDGTFVKETTFAKEKYSSGSAEELFAQYDFGALLEKEDMDMEASVYKEEELSFAIGEAGDEFGVFHLFVGMEEDGTIRYDGHIAFPERVDCVGEPTAFAFTDQYICLVQTQETDLEEISIVDQDTLNQARQQKNRSNTIFVYRFFGNGVCEKVYEGYIDSGSADDWYEREFKNRESGEEKEFMLCRRILQWEVAVKDVAGK